MLGREKCTWGPNYWCASRSNAENCGAGVNKNAIYDDLIDFDVY